MANIDFDYHLIDVLEQDSRAVAEYSAGHELVRAIREQVQGKKVVLLGEASHGTAGFYRLRAEVTQHLIVEEGFDAVAVEADWPDAYRVNRFVAGRSEDMDADVALSNFERFPTWMWRNTEVLAFIRWLRNYNEETGRYGRQHGPVGFYGLDLYSMTTSMRAVLAYLDKIDPKEAAAARARYGCFGQFIENPQACAYAIASGRRDPCEREVSAQLTTLQRAGRPDGETDV